ncbi:hypothetical protein H310_00818 [Aphanomyces invadans]|uniref:CBM1 domain-containing protein n=1 Tax=Aphanomyces invadans TaxID=157072 RepID=A0A024UVJ7_9STRA|nr:hypothetical protein H310_00818 [Aphanomyces invadans]ETW10551.1 hypothetical protein H310_00818 [Aphanomyces invadans]|eukprot:XP_008861962.1 hypothetical protein H310_00818 [Aphanomyces invadans]
MVTKWMLLAAVALLDAHANPGCAQDFSQCNGENWPFSVCCLHEGFSCTYINPDLSLCLQLPVRNASSENGVIVAGTTRQRFLRGFAAMAAASEPATHQNMDNSVNRPVGYLGQCGGIGYGGTTTCTHGLFCHVESPYYSSCLFNPTDDSHVAVWRKCGGANWSGLTQCQEGSTCQVQTVWYSQCVPLV